MNLPWDYKKCAGSLHFTLLESYKKYTETKKQITCFYLL